MEQVKKNIKNKKILITGCTGFKGSWLSLLLTLMGAKVMGYALHAESHQTLFKDLLLADKIEYVNGDVLDYEKFYYTVNEFQPDMVFHLAAQSLVQRSYVDPRETYQTNVIGTVNIMEAVRAIKSIRVLINVTSDKCYKNKEWIWGYRENDRLGGHDPYSASKAAAEIVTESYLDSFFIDDTRTGVASVRAGNVIGGGDWAEDRIVPDAMRALISNKPILVRNPNAIRPWQHVLEPLYGYVLLASCLWGDPEVYQGSWNFGPRDNSVKTVRSLLNLIINEWGVGEISLQRDVSLPHEARLLALNCDKAHQKLSWSPVWDFSDCVRNTVSWYKEVRQGASVLEVTERQINEYFEGLRND